jgi:hypothetical protein
MAFSLSGCLEDNEAKESQIDCSSFPKESTDELPSRDECTDALYDTDSGEGNGFSGAGSY